MRSVGNGPGEQTPDGCSVELYKVTPYQGELDLLLPMIRPGATVLELGCGAGRMSKVLYNHGIDLIVVDESTSMLDSFDLPVTKVNSTIEDLMLDQHFDVVILASYLINSPSLSNRLALAKTIAKHLHHEGIAFIQRSPEHLLSLEAGHTSSKTEILTTIEKNIVSGNQCSMEISYQTTQSKWSHSFVTEILSLSSIGETFEQVGLSIEQTIGETGEWVKLRSAA